MIPYIDVNSNNFVVGVFFGIIIAWLAEGISLLFKYIFDKLMERRKK